MTGVAVVVRRRWLPARPAGALLMELRAAWASGRRVVLTIAGERFEGHVTAVAATGVTVKVDGRLIPVARVLAVHLPSRLGDSTVRAGGFHGDGRAPAQIDGQTMLWDG